MSGMSSIWIVGGIALLIVIGVAAWLINRGKKFSLTDTPDGQKPEWMRELPPQETQEALKEDRKKMAVFDLDPGEKVSAPFVEQIEDIVHSRLSHNPQLKDRQVDFGTNKDGALEVIVDGTSYSAVDKIPDEYLRTVIEESIADYKKRT